MTEAQKALIERVVMTRLETLYRPPVPTEINGEANPAYRIAWDEYVDALGPFGEAVLESGWRLFRNTWQGRAGSASAPWPPVATFRQFFVEAEAELREDRKRAEQAARPKLPPAATAAPRPPLTEAERAEVEAKTSRAKQAFSWNLKPPLTDGEFTAWYRDGILPERVKALEARAEAEASSDPCLEARRLAGHDDG